LNRKDAKGAKKNLGFFAFFAPSRFILITSTFAAISAVKSGWQ